jgi:D-alanyl-D-alanine carboxypeptidase/D-alanyl-D-alanine-endopeptidase (penicillin-binding protein 4)
MGMRKLSQPAVRTTLIALNVVVLILGVLALPSTAPETPVAQRSAIPAHVEDTLVPVRPEPIPTQAPPSPPARPSLSDLRNQILGALSASGASSEAVSVWIEGHGFVFQRNAEQELVPASTQKIFVAASALNLLGPDHRFTTRVTRVGDIAMDGTLQGDIVLLGGGDPSLSRGDLEGLARVVASSGIRRVSGTVLGNEDRFDRVRTAPGWKPDFVTHESGTLSALAVDGNGYRNDPEFIAEPALANAQLFRDMLTAGGVEVANPAALASTQIETGVELAAKDSAPLGELVAYMLKESDNFYAELIVKEMGFKHGSPSTAGGIDAMRQFASLQRLPIGPSADGSGLSSENRQSASAQMQWLTWIDTHQQGFGFQQMLPSACSGNGTLKKRMCGSFAAGRVFAKSGGLPKVATLAGYATTAPGRRVRFAFLLTGSVSGKAARLAIDNALIAITSFNG